MTLPILQRLQKTGEVFTKFGFDYACQPLNLETAKALEVEWHELADNASERNIFSFPSFVIASLPLFTGFKPYLLAIRSQGLLIGVVLLRRDLGYAKLPIPFWRTAMHYEQYLATPLVRAGYEAHFAHGLCDWLDNAPANCCFVKLSQISADGAIAATILEHAKSHNGPYLIVNRFERAAIALTGGAESALSSNRKKSLRRSLNRLEKMGEVTFERLSEESQLSTWLTDFLAMENTGWKKDNGSSILSCLKETAFYQHIVKESFAKGNLHFSRLCLDGKAIAYTLDIKAPPVSYCLKSAIDQSYRKYSPGIIMEYETLRYYQNQSECDFVDSCSSPDNAMLNELWPDQKPIIDLALARNGFIYKMIFRLILFLKKGVSPDQAKA